MVKKRANEPKDPFAAHADSLALSKGTLEGVINDYVADVKASKDRSSVERAHATRILDASTAHAANILTANGAGLTKDHPVHGILLEDIMEIFQRLTEGRIPP